MNESGREEISKSSTLRARFRELFASVAPGREDVLHDLRAIYSEDVVFQDPMQKIRGLEAFFATNRKLIARATELRFDVEAPVGTDDEFFLAWTMRFRGKFGPLLETDGVTHVKTVGGRVVYHRDHWDLATLTASALPGGPSLLRTLMRPLV